MQNSEVKVLLEEYDSVFAKPKYLSHTTRFNYMILLIPESKKVNVKPYKSSFMYKEMIKRLLMEML